MTGGRSAFTELKKVEFWSQRKTWIEIRVKSESLIIKFFVELCLNVAGTFKFPICSFSNSYRSSLFFFFNIMIIIFDNERMP